MRADRLVATLLLLQAKGKVTAAEVARELEVSPRTARRDLEALAMSGVPVYSTAGRGGGWSLVGGARTDLTGLTAAEATALFTVAGPSSTATPEVKAALRKLVQALPAPFRAGAEAAADAVRIDPAGWGRFRPRPPPAHLDTLRRAVIDVERVRLGYADRGGRRSERLVDPLGLVEKGGVWYLLADTADGRRTFRVTRVTSAEPAGEPATRPATLDLEAAWQAVVDEVDARRRGYRVTVRAEPRVVATMRGLFGPAIVIGGEAEDGRVELELHSESPWVAAAQLASFGGAVEAVEPVEVRQHLASIASELHQLYGSPPIDGPAPRPAGRV
jgi:predicted DNA-binding transcriptional regulator YafY